jgi:hypothetical protein
LSVGLGCGVGGWVRVECLAFQRKKKFILLIKEEEESE